MLSIVAGQDATKRRFLPRGRRRSKMTRREELAALREASQSALTGAVGRARRRSARRRGEPHPEQQIEAPRLHTPAPARHARASLPALPYETEHGSDVLGFSSRDFIDRTANDIDSSNASEGDLDDLDVLDDHDQWEACVDADAAAAAAVTAALASGQSTGVDDDECVGEVDTERPVLEAEKHRRQKARTVSRIMTARALGRYNAHIVLLCAMLMRMDSAAEDSELQGRTLSVVPCDAAFAGSDNSSQTEIVRRFVLWFRRSFQATLLIPGEKLRRACNIRERVVDAIQTSNGDVLDLVVVACAAMRAMCLRCRIVIPMHPLPYKSPPTSTRINQVTGRKVMHKVVDHGGNSRLYAWLEVFIDGRWIHVDPIVGVVDVTDSGEIDKSICSVANDNVLETTGTPKTRRKSSSSSSTPVSSNNISLKKSSQPATSRESCKVLATPSLTHVVAAECGALTDVTRRYVSSWQIVLKERPPHGLFEKTLGKLSTNLVLQKPASLKPAATSGIADSPKEDSEGNESESRPNTRSRSSRLRSARNYPTPGGGMNKTSGKSKGVAQAQFTGRAADMMEDTAIASEQKEFDEKAMRESVPTTLSALRNHPLYVIERHLKRYEVVYPRGPVLGHVGPDKEPVFLRSHVRLLHTRERWIREMRRVKDDAEPITNVKSRTKRDSDEQALADLFGEWQTEPLVIPPCVNGQVPKNERGNVDLWTPAHLPRGAVHVAQGYSAAAAKKLGFDYAPCMTGFDIRGGRSIPHIEGIVTAAENEEAIREAATAIETRMKELADARARQDALARWRDVLKRLRAKLKVEKKYGGYLKEEEDGTYEAIQKRKGELRRKELNRPKSRLSAKEDAAFAPADEAKSQMERDEEHSQDFQPRKRARDGSSATGHRHEYSKKRRVGQVWVRTCEICGIEVAYEEL